MAKTTQFGQVQTDTVVGRTIKGIKIHAYLTHSLLNTPFTTNDFLWNQVNIKLTLRRANSESVRINENMRNIGCLSNYYNAQFRGAKDFSTTMNVLVAAAAGVNQVVSATQYIDFKGFINLGLGDTLIIEYNVPSAAASTNVNQSLSYVYGDWDDGIGIEYSTPKLDFATLQANQQNQVISIDNNCERLAVLNYDQSGSLYINRVIDNYTCASDKWTLNNNYYQLLDDQQRMFVNKAEADLRIQSFMIFDNEINPFCNFDNPGIELDKVSLQLNLISANVTATNNVIGWYHYETNMHLIQRGSAMNSKHQARMNAKYAGGEHNATPQHAQGHIQNMSRLTRK